MAAGLLILRGVLFARRAGAVAAGSAAPAQSLLIGLDFSSLSAIAYQAEESIQDAMSTVKNTVSTWDIPARGEPYRAAIYAAEDRYGLPRNLLARQIQQESDFNPRAYNAGSGARGLGQFTSIALIDYPHDPYDAMATIDAAARFMRDLYRRFGRWDLALAAYNWGQGNQGRDLRDGIIGNEWPDETRQYVKRITADVPVVA